ncbi:MAG: family 20 glycosylhydrolase [bacterium]
MDKPFLGFHYDIARGNYLKPEMFCQALRLSAQSGYTHFLPYLENMIHLPSMERACPSCAYTAGDWSKFEDVARKTGIELVPHFNVIGHTELISPAYPELCSEAGHDGRPDIDVESDASREWMLRCLGEFCDISHSQYFLIGGDEWQPSNRQLARPGFDVAKVWGNRINAAVDCLVKRGRRPIVWHDMLMHFPEARQQLSRQAVVALWFYDVDSDYAALSTFKALGFKTLMASTVFSGGVAGSALSHRSVNALKKARESVNRHHGDGLIVTSWEECRWELQEFNIAMGAKVLEGGEPPAEIVDVLSLQGAWSKIPTETVQARQWKAEIEALLKCSAWDAAPEMRRVIRAQIQGNVQDSIASYERYHFSQGNGFKRASTQQFCPAGYDEVIKPLAPVPANDFGLKVISGGPCGDILQFVNGAESFEVYPKFGASLQDWQRAGEVIIAETMGSFVTRGMQPGGYRSYSASGGLRLIWAMGVHSNPCILWQYPWEWTMLEQTPDVVCVELKLDLPHGVFAIRISIARGKTGFVYEASCINKLEHAYGAFNFNFPCSYTLQDLGEMELEWEKDGVHCEVTVAERAENAFWIPAQGSLSLRKPGWVLRIDADPAQTAGYFIDWGANFITPDLHGVYRPLKVADRCDVRWTFGNHNDHT